MLHSPLHFTHQLLKQTINYGDTVIDATVGNGNDTLLLAELVGESGKVIGFDIQKSAIDATHGKLVEADFSQRVDLFQTGHENLLSVYSLPNSVSAVVFNLGYLPKGDKSIVTHPETTLKAIEGSLDVLKKNGLLLIMIYHGHEGGQEEKEAVVEYVESLPQKNYQVLKYAFINQKNNPPFLIAIEKKQT